MDEAGLVVPEVVAVQHDAARLVLAGLIQLGRVLRVDPTRAVQCGGGQPHQGCLAARPQPRRHGFVNVRELGSPRHIYIPEHRVVLGSELIAVDLARRQCLGTQEEHAVKTAVATRRFPVCRT